MKVLFVNDSTTNTNWGDRAAAIALMEMIRESSGRITYSVTEDSLCHSTFGPPASQPDVASESGAHRIARLCTPPAVLGVRRRFLARRAYHGGPGELIPERWEDFETAAGRIRHEPRYGWPEVLQAMDEAEVAVIHGASIDGHGIIPRTDLFLTYLMKTKFRKPVLIVNHTADLEDPDLLRMAEHVYPLFDDVVFRDPISAERCASLCGGRFAADTAFRFEPAARQAWATLAGRLTYFDIFPHTARFDPGRPYLCLGGSSILWSGWDLPRLIADFATLVEAIQAVYRGQVVLTASDVPEQKIFEPLAAQMGLPLIGVTTPVQQAVDIVGNADVCITGRWHPGIFALRGGVPVIALSSKTFKMQALMRAAGLPETTFDALDLAGSRDALVGLLRQYLERDSEWRDQLRGWAARQAKESWDNVSYLRRWHEQGRAARP